MLLSALHPTSSSSFGLKSDPQSLRRASIPYRVPLAPLGNAMEEYRFGGGAASGSSGHGGDDLPQSSSRHYRNSTSSSRRASLPPAMFPSPTSATFRHRPSIASSVTTNGTSTSNSTSADDAYLLQRQLHEGSSITRDRDLPGMYSGLQSYTFGSSSINSPQPGASSSTSLYPPGTTKQRRGSRSFSRRSSLNASGDYDSEMYAGSDVGSAYSPEDNRDVTFVASQRRWDRAMASTSDQMDIDRSEPRRLSRDQGSTHAGRSSDKKRERNGHRRGTIPASMASGSMSQPSHGQENREVLTEDEEASARITGRSKMRAIDDGSRRPSLPINAVPLTSASPLVISPLTGASGLFASKQSQYDTRVSISSSTTATVSPSTPTAVSFAAIQSGSTGGHRLPKPTVSTAIAHENDSSTNSPSSSSALPSSSSSSDSPQYSSPQKIQTGNRPRSRSNRAAKPLPYLPLAPANPNNWVAPWSAQSASNNNSKATRSESIPFDLPPPNVNPFLSSPLQQQATVSGNRNPFVKKGPGMARSLSPPLSRASPPAENAGSRVGGTKSSPPMVPKALSVPAESAPLVASQSCATADFDLDFILSGAVTDANAAPHVSDVGTYTARKASLAPSLVEDTFTRFVNKFDDDFGERRDQWSYQIERASSSSTEGQGDYWRCENMGRYWVGRETALEDGHGGGGYDGFTPENSITVRYCPPEELSKSQARPMIPEQEYFNASGGMDTMTTPRLGSPSQFYSGDGGMVSPSMTPSQKRSNVRVQVKKHSRGPAFTLFLGPRGPRSLAISRPSILLAPKAFQLQASVPQKGKVSSMKSKSSISSSTASLSETLAHGSPTPSRSNSPSSNTMNWGPSSSSLSTLIGSNSHHGDSNRGSPKMHRRETSQSMPEKTVEQLQQIHHPAGISRGQSPNHHRHPHAAVLSPDPATISLDQMSVAAATGRLTSVHKQAFDTLSPEDGQVVLEHLKNRTSLGIRLKRAFSGRDRDGSGSSRSGPESVPMLGLASGLSSLSSHGSNGHDHHHHHHDGGKEGRTSSPQTSGSGRHNKDDNHHHSGPGMEAAFEPPWMLMTPMYVREAVVAAERSMYTGFAQLGLAAEKPNKKANGKKNGLTTGVSSLNESPIMTAAMRRNSILDTVPNEAMCMVLPLWDLSLDMKEDRRKRHKTVDDLDFDLDDLDEEDEEIEEQDTEDSASSVSGLQDPEAAQRAQLLKDMVKRRKLLPPPKVERKYLLAYYVPFNVKRQSLAPTPTVKTAASATPHETRSSKKRSQAPNSTSGRHSMKRRNSGSGHPTTSKPSGIRSFRVVARILTAAELRDSGLSPPRNIVDPKRMQQQSTAYYHSSLNYQRMDRRLSTSSILGDPTPPAFSAVIAVCHDRRKGVEFVPEGLDSLGLCGDGTVMGSNGNVEKLPPLFPPAHMVPVLERLTPPLNAVGKQVVEMIWSGCLALTELGL
ncbi:hypothetical protein FRB95_002076 [Tulasnella sp. JGI-2019a]|nr:hypothetical protein FRB95_002076 [Tulasnella sp. JGI-2019a]